MLKKKEFLQSLRLLYHRGTVKINLATTAAATDCKRITELEKKKLFNASFVHTQVYVYLLDERIIPKVLLLFLGPGNCRCSKLFT